ncbi:hypothetical protein E2C01_066780 [Portunus trituberculatus]|uniref:Uncharacterized protein n=1 Tax=Portunus trituberculatus TaxID=210409 RepID=A0A5B7HMG2_PORTR|nr:hypothetical protein [Portunus trituberculatus]
MSLKRFRLRSFGCGVIRIEGKEGSRGERRSAGRCREAKDDQRKWDPLRHIKMEIAGRQTDPRLIDSNSGLDIPSPLQTQLRCSPPPSPSLSLPFSLPLPLPFPLSVPLPLSLPLPLPLPLSLPINL